jgi:hypothetical protein
MATLDDAGDVLVTKESLFEVSAVRMKAKTGRSARGLAVALFVVRHVRGQRARGRSVPFYAMLRRLEPPRADALNDFIELAKLIKFPFRAR